MGVDGEGAGEMDGLRVCNGYIGMLESYPACAYGSRHLKQVNE